MLDLVTANVYGHSIILLMCLLLISVVTKFDQADFLSAGMYLFIAWFILEFYYVLSAEYYWMSVIHLTVSSSIMFVIFIGLAQACEKYGTRAHGDGAGWGYAIPAFMYFYIFILSLLLKSIFLVWNYIF